MSSNKGKDLYKILRVTRNATINEIKSSYRKLALKLHPDLTGNDTNLSEEFKSITSAYEILSDNVTRSNYDLSLGINSSDLHSNRMNYNATNTRNNHSTSARSSTSGKIYTGNSVKDEHRSNPNEWIIRSYGMGNIYDSTRKTDPFHMPGNKHQEFYRKQAARETEKLKKKIQEQGWSVDLESQASEALRRKRQQRRDEDGIDNNQSNTNGLCIIS